MSKKPLLGNRLRNAQPKLRMIANGSADVNVMRAAQCGAIAVEKKETLAKPTVPIQMGATRPTASQSDRAVRGKQSSLPDEVVANVFIESVRFPGAGSRASRGFRTRAEMDGISTAQIRLSDLPDILEREDVLNVELGQPLAPPRPAIHQAEDVDIADRSSERRVAWQHDHQDGAGVLIGIIDVGGFDFAHEDFLAIDGTTRFHCIWDQGSVTRAAPSGTGQFDYGGLITAEHMNLAIESAPSLGVPAWELEPQSQMTPSSHGTHVASTAAGNHGVCRKATIAGVLLALSDDDTERRKSFYDSTRIVDAIQFLLGVGDDLGMPVSINISLGTNGHAHDSSSAASRWIDSALARPGRAVSIAAGNAGQEMPDYEGDIGHLMGRIHTGGRIESAGLTKDIEWLVIGNGIADVSENELEVWFSPQDRIAVSVRPPNGDWIGPIEPGEYIENQQLEQKSFISIYNELYYPSNGANYVSIYLSPYFSPDTVIGVQSGIWQVRLHGREIRDGEFHGWIERDDPYPRGRIGERQFWNFPSFFGSASNVDESSVSSLACGLRISSVANLDDAREVINSSSSQGPTRDGRYKPDVAAPGTDIIAANGFADLSTPWVSMTGTSMASPYVAGVIGLMLAVEPNLTAAQIEGIIHRTADPLPGASYRWRNDAGFGRIDPTKCLDEASTINRRVDKTP